MGWFKHILLSLLFIVFPSVLTMCPLTFYGFLLYSEMLVNLVLGECISHLAHIISSDCICRFLGLSTRDFCSELMTSHLNFTHIPISWAILMESQVSSWLMVPTSTEVRRRQSQEHSETCDVYGRGCTCYAKTKLTNNLECNSHTIKARRHTPKLIWWVEKEEIYLNQFCSMEN